MGRLSGRRRPRARVDARMHRVARGTEHVPDPRQKRGELRHSRLDQMERSSRATARASRSTPTARSSEGSGQNRSSSATSRSTRRRFRPRCCRASLATRFCKSRATSVSRLPRSLFRELLYISTRRSSCRHRSRGHADPIGGQGHDRSRQSRPDHGGHPESVLAIVNGEAPDRHGWLKFVYPGEPLQTVGAAGGAAAGTGRQR
jgi:hypothetical protein